MALTYSGRGTWVRRHVCGRLRNAAHPVAVDHYAFCVGQAHRRPALLAAKHEALLGGEAKHAPRGAAQELAGVQRVAQLELAAEVPPLARARRRRRVARAAREERRHGGRETGRLHRGSCGRPSLYIRQVHRESSPLRAKTGMIESAGSTRRRVSSPSPGCVSASQSEVKSRHQQPQRALASRRRRRCWPTTQASPTRWSSPALLLQRGSSPRRAARRAAQLVGAVPLNTVLVVRLGIAGSLQSLQRVVFCGASCLVSLT